ncbi:MAG: SHOCT domain-containing protein [Muribaculaceae bacterium]|nr:SHOCT domain-containing protein [Muribaculaceae bacterium]
MTQVQLQALAELKKLKDAQIINDAEFAKLKTKILEDDSSKAAENLQHCEVSPTDNQPKKPNNNLWIIIIGTITFFVIIVIAYFVATTKSNSNHSSSYWEEEATVTVEEAEVVEASPYEY